MKIAEQSFANEKVATFPKFKAGDTITVTYRIKERKFAGKKVEAAE